MARNASTHKLLRLIKFHHANRPSVIAQGLGKATPNVISATYQHSLGDSFHVVREVFKCAF